MDQELQAYYDARFELFASKGWNDLMEDVEAMIMATDHISGVKDANDLFFKKGELSIMTWLRMLKQTTNQAYEELRNEPESDV